MISRSLLRSLVLSLVLASVSFGQGKENYLNFESGENEALAIARVPDIPGSGPQTFTSYLLVANTVDDSVEVRSVSNGAFVARVPTGQSPIGVHVKPSTVVLDARTYRPSGTTSGDTWKLAYSVNWIGDSITLIGLRHVAASGGQTLVARALRTVWVGDEPTSIAFLPEVSGVFYTEPTSIYHESLTVTHGTSSTWDVRDPVTLEPFTNGTTIWAGLEMLENPGVSGGSPRAVREAWQIKYRPTTAGVQPTFFVLNRRGGNFWTSPVPSAQSNYSQVASNPYYFFPEVNSNPQYDFDLWGPIDPTTILVIAPSTPVTSVGPRVGNFGSTNFAMATAANGDLYVVGQIARNNDASVVNTAAPFSPFANGESRHALMETGQTGFVQSMLWRFPAGGGVPQSLDLNASPTGNLRVTQPTGVAIRGTGSAGTEIFVTGFNSDTLCRVTFNGTTIAGATPTVADLAHPTTPFPGFNGTEFTGRMMGPRSIVLFDEPGQTAKLFVLNKVDRSIYIVDPNAFPTTAAGLPLVSLAIDPRPSYMRDGQPMLYSSRLSNKGTSSCASCHIDGHFDGLSWNLSGAPAPTVLPGALPNGANKALMFTQSLRGLATFEVGSWKPTGATGVMSNTSQRLFTTEPLHWRGDKGFFEDFNAAFANLLAIANTASTPWVFIDPTNGDLNRGVPIPDMDQFRDFVFSIHYPPNPEQPPLRVHSGEVGAKAFGSSYPNPVMGPAGQSYGGQLGLELFFTNVSVDTSCAGCHMLPSGTNNICTEFEADIFSSPGNVIINDIETAALRGIISKEKRLMRKVAGPPPSGGTAPLPMLIDIGAPDNPLATSLAGGATPLGSEGAVIGEFGLIHNGFTNPFILPQSETTRSFTHGFLFGTTAERDATAIFQRELDTGSAPIIGFTLLADAHVAANPALAANVFPLASLMQQQAEKANAGVVLRARLAGVDRGFFYDVPSQLYVEESFVGPPGTTPMAPQGLIPLLLNISATQTNDNTLVFISVPLGSERRMANIAATATQAVVSASGAVSGIQLLPMVTNTAYARVPLFPRAAVLPEPFLTTWIRTGQTMPGPQPQIAADIMQQTMGNLNPAGPMFNLPPSTAPKQGAPRRFVVQGDGILPGAKLRLWLPEQPDVNTATPGATWQTWTAPTTTPTAATNRFIDMPIYPRRFDNTDAATWETAAEIDPVNMIGLMHGGPSSPATQYCGGLSTYNLLFNMGTPGWASANFYSTALLAGAIPLGGLNGGLNAANIATFYASLLWPILTTFPTIFGPERWNWYFVEIINTHRPNATSAPVTTVSNGGWQRLKF